MSSAHSNYRSLLIEETDRWFSLYVRYLYSKDDHTSCVGCGLTDYWRSMSCGHYVPRKYLHTRWDICNVAPVCGGCNDPSNSQGYIADFINKTFGEGTSELMKQQSIETTPLLTYEIKMIKEFWRDRLDTIYSGSIFTL